MGKKILVVIDCQNDFISGTLASKEAQKKIPNIVKKIKEFDGDYIILTRDTHSDYYLETKEGQQLPIIHCVKDSWGWEIEDNIAEAFTERINDSTKVVGTIIDKPTFGSCKLAAEIGDIVGTENAEIEFCGFCTDICVVSNVLLVKATVFKTADIKVDSSCCAGVTVKSHNAALTTMKMCQINVIDE